MPGHRHLKPLASRDAPIYQGANDHCTNQRTSIVHRQTVDRKHRWERHPDNDKDDVAHSAKIDERPEDA